MAVNPEQIEAAKATDEYRKGVEILGDPDDYASRTMLAYIGFFYMLTEQNHGNLEGLDAFIRQLGIIPVQHEEGVQLQMTDEEALMAAFTYIVGRGGKELFEHFLKLLKEHPEVLA